METLFFDIFAYQLKLSFTAISDATEVESLPLAI
jgi:hypothetical protein